MECHMLVILNLMKLNIISSIMLYYNFCTEYESDSFNNQRNIYIYSVLKGVSTQYIRLYCTLRSKKYVLKRF